MRKASLFERLFISVLFCVLYALLFLPQTAEVFDLRRGWHFAKSFFPSLSEEGVVELTRVCSESTERGLF